MKLHNLKPPHGARQNSIRKGRGVGSGFGKTAGRGHKGQKARSGGGKGPYFEGGQTPLQRRLPKYGFTNIFKKKYVIVNLKQLEERFAAGAEVTPETLQKAGLVKNLWDGVRILGQGEITKPLTVKAHGFRRQQRKKCAAGGG